MHTNKDKTSKAALIAKLWQSVGYSNSSISCGNCKAADPDKWEDGAGECTVLGYKLTFPIREEGICKLHSSFKHE